MSSPEPIGPSRAAPPLWLIFTITLTGILANTLIGPAIPDILDHFDQPRSRAGLFVGAGALPGIVLAPIIGVLADRFGRRNVLVPCLVSFGVFGALSALAPTFEILVGLRLLQGFGSAGLINLAVVIIGDHWTGIERAKRTGQNAAVLTCSLAVFPPLGGGLTELGGWRLSFAPYLIGLATAALVWRRLPDSRPDESVDLLAQLRATRVVARQPIVLAVIAMGFVIFMLIFGLFLTALPVHLEEEFGLSAGGRGLVIAAPALTSTLVALNLGRLRARFGVRRIMMGAASLFTVAFVGIGLAPTLPLLLAAAMVYGLGEGIYIPTLQDVVSGASTPASRGAIVAAWVGAARAGQTVGPLGTAATYAATSTGATFVIGGALAGGLLVATAMGPVRDEHPALASGA